MTVDLLNISGVPVDRQIAAQMVVIITGASLFSGVVAEQVADPKRRLKDMTEGQVLIDCIGVGVRSEAWNRRRFAKSYITHAAIRCKLTDGKVTGADLDELGSLRQALQEYFEEDSRRFEITSGAVTLERAEPFTLVSRAQLYGDGLFLSPVEFTWKHHPE